MQIYLCFIIWLLNTKNRVLYECRLNIIYFWWDPICGIYCLKVLKGMSNKNCYNNIAVPHLMSTENEMRWNIKSTVVHQGGPTNHRGGEMSIWKIETCAKRGNCLLLLYRVSVIKFEFHLHTKCIVVCKLENWINTWWIFRNCWKKKCVRQLYMRVLQFQG